MKGYVYILTDDKGKYYIGSTTDINRRSGQHKSGHTKTTNRMKNIRIVLQQEYETLSKAREIERRIKKLKRKDYIYQMIRDGEIKMK